jgi:hypothetical protein
MNRDWMCVAPSAKSYRALGCQSPLHRQNFPMAGVDRLPATCRDTLVDLSPAATSRENVRQLVGVEHILLARASTPFDWLRISHGEFLRVLNPLAPTAGCEK